MATDRPSSTIGGELTRNPKSQTPDPTAHPVGGQVSPTPNPKPETRHPTCNELPIRVRYVEADPMGYLHHAHYFTYFEMGRTELLRSQGWTYREIEARGQFMVVAKIRCQFCRPARYDDLLSLRTWITRVTPARIEHRYELRRDGALLAEAESTLACVDAQGRLQPIPQEFLSSSAAG